MNASSNRKSIWAILLICIIVIIVAYAMISISRSRRSNIASNKEAELVSQYLSAHE